MTSPLDGFERITIKIGSALLVDAETGALRRSWLASLAQDLADLKQQGRDIIVVSSGAVALGRRILNLKSKALPLDQAQAAASVGQLALVEAWRTAFETHNITIGQILLTPNITEERRNFINARATMGTLLALGAIPVINENDSVATAEIRFGDNDRLSARVASMLASDCLILLSDVDGLYSSPPQTPGARHLPLISTISTEIEAMAKGSTSQLSRGGMITKLEAAKIATRSGTAMIIAKGSQEHPIKALAAGARHTLFSARQSPTAARKRWILSTLEIAGTIHIDAGAAKALLKGKSLLPIGVTRVRGDFSRGDAVSIVGPNEREIARGLAGMNTEDAHRAKGKKSQTIAQMLGELNRTEMVHADNLVLLTTGAD